MSARTLLECSVSSVRAALLFFVGAQIVLQLVCTIPTVDCFFIDSKQSPHTSEWSYANQVDWAHKHRDCSRRAQSPIDIQHPNVIISNNLRLHFYNYKRQLKFLLSNAHHTVKMSPVLGTALEREPNNSAEFNSSSPSLHDIITADEYVESVQQQQQQLNQQHSPGGQASGRLRLAPADKTTAAPAIGPKSAGAQQADKHQINNNELDNIGENSLPYGGAPSIKLDWLDDGNNEFKLRDIHFHWGERRDNGSEHAIDGRRAAMEMHLVHIKRDLEKSAIGFTSDSITVIAVLIESHRKSNADFNPIVNELVKINATDEAQEIEYKSIEDLLPSNLGAFYTYSGSLTTPPCYQVVTWIVMAERLNMNAKQIEMFRQLYAPPNEQQQQQLIVPNVRSLQRLNGRTILASFTKHGGRFEPVLSAASGSIYNNIKQFNLLLQFSGQTNWQLLWNVAIVHLGSLLALTTIVGLPWLQSRSMLQ